MYTNDKASTKVASQVQITKRPRPRPAERPDAPPCAKKIRETWFSENDDG
jgi:hypothetical protein